MTNNLSNGAKSIYDLPCPVCAGKITSTARTPDSTIAPTSCEAGHTFMRSVAIDAFASKNLPKRFKELDDKQIMTSIKLEAASRLIASQELRLMAKATPVTKVAELGIKEIGRQMALRGYIANTEVTRAFYTTTFEKQEKDSDPCVFQLVGWHGNGHYGSEKTILEFYDESRGRKPVITIGQINDDNLTEENQQHVVEKILDYVRKHC